jgi:hypothetical protein
LTGPDFAAAALYGKLFDTADFHKKHFDSPECISNQVVQPGHCVQLFFRLELLLPLLGVAIQHEGRCACVTEDRAFAQKNDMIEFGHSHNVNTIAAVQNPILN